MSTLPDHDPRCLDEQHAAVELVIEGRSRGVDSITVARLLPAPRRRMVGPFVFLDHMGPVTLAPGVGFDVRPHPHIGLSTVTYFLDGENVHRDSLGSVQRNVPGDVNIMTAGRGVVHSERADPAWRAAGGLMHGVQIWLALPVEQEDCEPSFEHHPKATLPELALAPDVRARILLGEAFGARSPITHPSQPLLVDLELAAGAHVALPALTAIDGIERAVFVISGEVAIADLVLATDHLAVVHAGPVHLRALAPARALVLGGPSVGERLIEWNFVSSSRDKIVRASAAWRAQSFPKIPGDDKEFIPLP